MKAIKFLLGLAFVFSVEQYSLSAAAGVDEMFEMDDCGGSLKPDAEQAMIDSELMSDDHGKEKEEKGFAYFMVTRGSIIVPKNPNGQGFTKFIKPPSTGHGVSMKIGLFEGFNSSPKKNLNFEVRQKQIAEAKGRFSCFYTIDPRKIYQKARAVGLNPPDACFFKVPFSRLLCSEKLLFQPWILPGTVFLMNNNKEMYREALQGPFDAYLELLKVLENERPAIFNRYFDRQFLEMYELDEPSLAWCNHLVCAKETGHLHYFFGIDSYLIEEMVDVTGLEPISWSDPLE